MGVKLSLPVNNNTFILKAMVTDKAVSKWERGLQSILREEANRRVRNDDDMKPTYFENGNKDSRLLQNETRLKQVLKQADYDKVIPLLDPLEEKQQLSIQEVMTLTGKARTTAWRYMKMLEEANVVVPEGETNNVVYRLKV